MLTRRRWRDLPWKLHNCSSSFALLVLHRLADVLHQTIVQEVLAVRNPSAPAFRRGKMPARPPPADEAEGDNPYSAFLSSSISDAGATPQAPLPRLPSIKRSPSADALGRGNGKSWFKVQKAKVSFKSSSNAAALAHLVAAMQALRYPELLLLLLLRSMTIDRTARPSSALIGHSRSSLRGSAADDGDLHVSTQVQAAEKKADAELDLLMRDLSGYDKPSRAQIFPRASRK